jgi:hypothetical protein
VCVRAVILLVNSEEGVKYSMSRSQRTYIKGGTEDGKG